MTTWVATVGKILVEGAGPGGNGFPAQFVSDSSGGGGGGAYARKAGIVVTIGNGYDIKYTKADGVTAFDFGTSQKAVAGGPGGASSAGSGGNTAVSVGDTKFRGGNGAVIPPSFPTPVPGGGGGGAASRTADGADASGQTGGGTGGNGGNAPNGAGAAGVNAGDGGGGAGNAIGPSASGGSGQDGWMIIYDDTSGNGWAGVLAGTSPAIATFGNAPPPPTPPASPIRRSSFYM